MVDPARRAARGRVRRSGSPRRRRRSRPARGHGQFALKAAWKLPCAWAPKPAFSSASLRDIASYGHARRARRKFIDRCGGIASTPEIRASAHRTHAGDRRARPAAGEVPDQRDRQQPVCPAGRRIGMRRRRNRRRFHANRLQVTAMTLRQRSQQHLDLGREHARHQPFAALRIDLVQRVERHRQRHAVVRAARLEAVLERELDPAHPQVAGKARIAEFVGVRLAEHASRDNCSAASPPLPSSQRSSARAVKISAGTR